MHEIRAFESERTVPVFVPPARNNAAGVLAVLSLLLFWHAARWNFLGELLPSPPFPGTPREWVAAFGMDMYRFRTLHEFWRAATALTMHADAEHALGNLCFGFLFLVPLCRRTGLGFGIFMTVLAGLAGNAANSLLKDAGVISLGFSTALFGAIGALCAVSGTDIIRHASRFTHNGGAALHPWLSLAKNVLMPLAAGLALLGILGGGGEAKTDYSAHILGFFAGIFIAIILLPLEKHIFSLPLPRQARMQNLLLFMALALPASAWGYALLIR